MNKSPRILGISAFYHDSAAALTEGGQIIAAAQEERFSRKKHDPRFPANAINYCLEEAQLETSDLDAIVYYENPVKSLDRVVQMLAETGDAGLDVWMAGAPGALGTKLRFEDLIKNELKCDVPVLYSEHHLSHAASAFYPSGFEEAAILTVDGVGEWATTTLAHGRDKTIEVLDEIHFPHSIGLLYSAFTQYCGFKVNSGEYKLMGLAPYGKPVFADQIRETLLHIAPDGSFALDMDYFGYLDSLQMTNDRFHELFGSEPREPESRLSQRECDLAASVQVVTEEAVSRLVHGLLERTGTRKLCLAGGVALNCVANGKLIQEGILEDIWIQPAAGDAGGALGAALHTAHTYFDVPRPKCESGSDLQQGSYLGNGFSNEEVKAYLDVRDLPYEVLSDDERAKTIASEIADGQIIGYMVGRMEFGPRSLGSRSILGDPRDQETQSTMNLKIKYRESFRPFAPAVLKEKSSEYFDLDTVSPYMLVVAPVQESIREEFELTGDEDLIDVVNRKRSSLPAITHVDFSARVQTVDKDVKPDFHQLLSEFHAITGVGVVVNTSFNVRGEPPVCSPRDAYTCFMRTEMDILVMENCVLRKKDQPEFADAGNWQEEFELD